MIFTTHHPKTTPFENLKAQPHRIFFFAGIVQGILFIALLGLNYGGVLPLEVSLKLYHAYALIFIVFTQFFAGFLLTTFPRYLATSAVTQKDYLPIVWLMNGGAFLFLGLSFVSEIALLAPIALVLIGYLKLFLLLLDIHTKSRLTNKSDTMWMLVGFASGIVGQLLFMMDIFLPLYAAALGVSFYLYTFFIVMSVSQKMMPFFASNAVVGYTIHKSPYFLLVLFLGLLGKVLLETAHFNAFVADALLFGVITYELLKWRLPFFKAPAILWVLFLSIWWAPVGFGLFIIQDFSALLGAPIYVEKSPLHTLALGYFTTVLIGFGTRVILGHSGRTPKADAYAIFLFGLIQVMTLLRIMAGLFPAYGYFHAILSVAGLWLIIFGMWAKRYLHILFER